MPLLSKWLYKFSIWLIILLFAVMVSVILLEVLARNVMNFSFSWSGELAQYCFVWMTFLGVGAVYKHNELIGFDVLLKKLPAKYQKINIILIQTVIIVFTVALTYYGFKKTFSPSVMVQTSTGFQIPMFYVYVSVPLGAIMLLVHVLANMMKNPEHKEEVIL